MIEGEVVLETAVERVRLGPGQLYTVPAEWRMSRPQLPPARSTSRWRGSGCQPSDYLARRRRTNRLAKLPFTLASGGCSLSSLV